MCKQYCTCINWVKNNVWFKLFIILINLIRSITRQSILFTFAKCLKPAVFILAWIQTLTETCVTNNIQKLTVDKIIYKLREKIWFISQDSTAKEREEFYLFVLRNSGAFDTGKVERGVYVLVLNMKNETQLFECALFTTVILKRWIKVKDVFY